MTRKSYPAKMTGRAYEVDEPFFVAQTFEPHDVESAESARAWWNARAVEASDKGGTFPRYTISDNGDGLLFECWRVRPVNQGDPRWHLNLEEHEVTE